MSFRRLDRASLSGWDDARAFEDLVPEFAFVACTEHDSTVQWSADALPCYEVVFVVTGRLRLWQGDAYTEGGAGDVFIIPPRALHREETPPGVSAELICLGASFRRASGRQRPFPMPLAHLLHLGRGHPVEQRLRRILTEAHQRAPAYSAVVLATVMEVFCELARATRGIAVHTPDAAEMGALRFGHQAREYIAAHYAEPLSVDAMARHFHLSRQYFNKLFRRATGLTPHAYLTHVRIRRASELLADPALPIKAVAARTGFEDPYHFAKCFKRHTGLTPAQYRRSG